MIEQQLTVAMERKEEAYNTQDSSEPVEDVGSKVQLPALGQQLMGYGIAGTEDMWKVTHKRLYSCMNVGCSVTSAALQASADCLHNVCLSLLAQTQSASEF